MDYSGKGSVVTYEKNDYTPGYLDPIHQFNQTFTESILESISDGVFTVDSSWRITSFNKAAEKITGIPRMKAIGRRCFEIFRSNMCGKDCALQKTMETHNPVINRSASIINSQGEKIPISVSTALLRNRDNEVIGGAETFRDLSIVEKLRNTVAGRLKVGEMVTRSYSMIKILDVLPQIASSDSTVLIQGETGTGKELIARAIHNYSDRNEKPFIAINCGALPDSLLESELFGYKAGAFTGANKDKIGRFAMAEGGTLFLDEIAEISPALQVKLLRVLQERSYEPLGATKTVHSDVRVISACNGNLPDLIKEGQFRQDLFYRINVIKIQLPPLRQRKEDIPLLIEHFVNRFNDTQEKSIKGVNQETMALLMNHDFPGNIRELENIIEHAFVLCNGGYITTKCIPEDTRKQKYVEMKSQGMEKAVNAVESQAIMEALKRNNFNRTAAARELGIHKSTFFRKIKNLGISLPHVDGRFNHTTQERIKEAPLY
ncbi:MAG: sigma 54-interacting transcriptional regulator [Desulfobulbaceae bacterium]|uniref:Sigma 54-interacting transcriptional regulator n=1 Tax=Candidatus Desulfobia pelagia TaxID=2841692 RepID=A0A8J6NF01_9BACT|nr:sigma 54-interacting transcriptional regulator [Candidatus Desulfobia pelagia]